MIRHGFLNSWGKSVKKNLVITTTIQCITPYFFRNYVSLVSRCICNFFLLLSTLCPYSLLTPNPAGYFVRRGSVQSFTLLLAKVGRSGGSFSKQAIARRRWLVHNHPECIELNCYCALKNFKAATYVVWQNTIFYSNYHRFNPQGRKFIAGEEFNFQIFGGKIQISGLINVPKTKIFD